MTIATLKRSYARERIDPRAAAALTPRSTTPEERAPVDLRSLKATFWRNPSILLSTLGINLLSMALPLTILQVYQKIVPNAALDTFAYLLAGLAMVIVADGALRAARSYTIAWQGARFEHLASREAIDRLTGTALQTYGKSPVGRHLEDLQAIETLRDFYGGSGLINLLEAPFVVIFLMMIFLIGGPIGFVPLALFVVCGAIAYVLGRQMREQIGRRNSLDMQRYNFILEVLNGLSHIKSQALESFMQRRYERLQSTSAKASADFVKLSTTSQACGAFFSYFVLFATAAAGAYMVIGGAMSQGELAACSLLAGRATQPFLRAVAFWSEYQTVQVAEGNISRILAYEPEATDRGRDRHELQGRIELQRVSKSYDDKVVLKDANLTVMPGEAILIDGAFGAGKSTLMKVMAGLSDATSGDVLLDGRVARDLDTAFVRRQIGYMPENAVLFRGTILDNLTLFEPERYLDRAMELVSELELDRVIARLPDGFETQVGDDLADLLPLGIRQQIGIVRVLARNPRILLFDQPNGGLDMGSDERLAKLIARLKGDVTMLMITQRGAYRRLADRAIILNRDGVLRHVGLPDAARKRISTAASGPVRVAREPARPPAAQKKSA